MADDISVKISAQIGELQSGLSEATSAIKGMADNVQDSFGKATEAGEGFGSKLGVALDVGLFLEFKEVATQALEAVRSAFEATIGKAEEFGLKNAELAERLGISASDAAVLSQSLQSVGSSGEEFAAIADRMVLRLHNNAKAFEELGIKTRDSNGELLNGQALIESAIATMETYKAGTEQNTFAHEVFGRSVAGVYTIMRVNDELLQHNKETMAALGVVTGGPATEAARSFQLAMADVTNKINDTAITIGQHLMPIVTEFIEQWGGRLTTALVFGENLFKQTAVAVLAFIEVFDELGIAVGGVISEMVIALVGFGKIAYDIFTGQWGKVSGDFQDYSHKMGSAFTSTLTEMSASAADFAKKTQAIFTGIGEPGKEDNEKPKGGTRTVAPKGKKDETRQINDEIAASDKALALEQVKMEEDKNNSLYALGQKATADHLATQLELESRKEAIELEYYNRKLANDAKEPLEVQKDKDKILLVEAQHAAAVAKIHEQAAAADKQLHDEEVKDAITAADAKLQRDLSAVQEKAKLHDISQSEEFAMEASLTSQTYQENLNRLDNEISTLAVGTRAYERAMAERAKLTQKYDSDIQKINDKAAEYAMQKWDTLGSSIKGSFTSAINGMILGTMTWQKAVGGIIDGVANAFLKMAEDMLTEWIATELKKMLFSQTTAATSAISQIGSAAGVAGANAFASTSAIPIVGPELAPAAAAAAVAETMGFTSLAVAEKGMVLDSDRLVSAHKEEMILPAGISNGLQNMIKNSGGGGPGSANLHYSPTVNGGGGSLKDMLARESSHMHAWFKSQVRDGKLKAGG